MKILICNVPTQDADTIANELVGMNLVACVNIIPSIKNIYRWKDAIETDEESILLIKTSDKCAPLTMDAIYSIHPYEIPEIIALPIEDQNVFTPHLNWVNENCISNIDNV